jgi:hypothetical protein
MAKPKPKDVIEVTGKDGKRLILIGLDDLLDIIKPSGRILCHGPMTIDSMTMTKCASNQEMKD